MSNAKWGNTWYEAPTQITRGGEDWQFAASAQEIGYLKRAGRWEALLRDLKANGFQYRKVWNRRNSEYELFIRDTNSGRGINAYRNITTPYIIESRPED